MFLVAFCLGAARCRGAGLLKKSSDDAMLITSRCARVPPRGEDVFGDEPPSDGKKKPSGGITGTNGGMISLYGLVSINGFVSTYGLVSVFGLGSIVLRGSVYGVMSNSGLGLLTDVDFGVGSTILCALEVYSLILRVDESNVLMLRLPTLLMLRTPAIATDNAVDPEPAFDTPIVRETDSDSALESDAGDDSALDPENSLLKEIPDGVA